jgi:hypothetical protein
MAEQLFTAIITRALSDGAFRDGLATSPEKTLANAGFVATSDQVRTITLANPAEWGRLAAEDILARIDLFYKKR